LDNPGHGHGSARDLADDRPWRVEASGYLGDPPVLRTENLYRGASAVQGLPRLSTASKHEQQAPHAGHQRNLAGLAGPDQAANPR
jgi:hypothetical protein